MKKTKTLMFRLTEAESVQVDTIAKLFKLSRSSVLRIGLSRLLDEMESGYIKVPTSTPPQKTKKIRTKKDS
ncbi:MAG: hypothetical protein RR553_01475 [Akkermansia sp.]